MMRKPEFDLQSFIQAADEGNTEAQFILGQVFAEGFGCDADEEKAIVYYRKAAEKGHVKARVNLALCLLAGSDQEQEADAKATKVNATERYARAHQVDVTKKQKEAVLLLKVAALSGDAKGQYNLADCYATGVGVSKDEAQAIQWYQKAAAQGHELARECLDILTAAKSQSVPEKAKEEQKAKQITVDFSSRQAAPTQTKQKPTISAVSHFDRDKDRDRDRGRSREKAPREFKIQTSFTTPALLDVMPARKVVVREGLTKGVKEGVYPYAFKRRHNKEIFHEIIKTEAFKILKETTDPRVKSKYIRDMLGDHVHVGDSSAYFNVTEEVTKFALMFFETALKKPGFSELLDQATFTQKRDLGKSGYAPKGISFMNIFINDQPIFLISISGILVSSNRKEDTYELRTAIKAICAQLTAQGFVSILIPNARRDFNALLGHTLNTMGFKCAFFPTKGCAEKDLINQMKKIEIDYQKDNKIAWGGSLNAAFYIFNEQKPQPIHVSKNSQKLMLPHSKNYWISVMPLCEDCQHNYDAVMCLLIGAKKLPELKRDRSPVFRDVAEAIEQTVQHKESSTLNRHLNPRPT